MSYKLICIDMDGTLLNNKHEISERNKEAIKKATERGVKVAVTTGRLFASAKYYAGLLGVKTPIISCNGAFIREKDEDKVIYESVLNEDQLDRIYDVIKKYDINMAYFNTPNTVISEKIVPEEHGYKVMNKMMGESKEKVMLCRLTQLIICLRMNLWKKLKAMSILLLMNRRYISALRVPIYFMTTEFCRGCAEKVCVKSVLFCTGKSRVFSLTLCVIM